MSVRLPSAIYDKAPISSHSDILSGASSQACNSVSLDTTDTTEEQSSIPKLFRTLGEYRKGASEKVTIGTYFQVNNDSEASELVKRISLSAFGGKLIFIPKEGNKLAKTMSWLSSGAADKNGCKRAKFSVQFNRKSTSTCIEQSTNGKKLDVSENKSSDFLQESDEPSHSLSPLSEREPVRITNTDYIPSSTVANKATLDEWLHKNIQEESTSNDDNGETCIKQDGCIQSSLSAINYSQLTEDNLNCIPGSEDNNFIDSVLSECTAEDATNLQDTLDEHTKGYHDEDLDETSYFPCPTCDEIFTDLADMKAHVLADKHGAAWLCFTCYSVFGKELALRIHHCLKTFEHKVVPGFYVCTKCSQVFRGSKIFAQHSEQCSFSEYCVQCATQFDSLRNILHHTKTCDQRTVACTTCDDMKHSIDSSPKKAKLSFGRVHCRCCGKCFDEMSEEFFHHEAKCGVNNRYENVSSSTVFWPPACKTVWARKCMRCCMIKFAMNDQDYAAKRKELRKQVHCTFCGKCFSEKSAEFIVHEDTCAWFQKCVLPDRRLTKKYESHNAEFNIFVKGLLCNFCGKSFSRKFKDFFRHEANCKTDVNRCPYDICPDPTCHSVRHPIHSDFKANHNMDIDAVPLDLRLKKSDAVTALSSRSFVSQQPTNALTNIATSRDKKFQFANAKTHASREPLEGIAWCSKCGHGFSAVHFAYHPCNYLQIHMQSCSVAIERIDTNFPCTGAISDYEKSRPLQFLPFVSEVRKRTPRR